MTPEDFMRGAPHARIADWRISTLLRIWVPMVLQYTDGNVRWAADELGVSQQTLRNWGYVTDASQQRPGGTRAPFGMREAWNVERDVAPTNLDVDPVASARQGGER